jgi:hypothetical protein
MCNPGENAVPSELLRKFLIGNIICTYYNLLYKLTSQSQSYFLQCLGQSPIVRLQRIFITTNFN